MGHGRKRRLHLVLATTTIFLLIFSFTQFAESQSTHSEDGPYSETGDFADPNFNTVINCSDHDGDALCTYWERYSGLYIYYAGKVYFYGCGNYGPDPDCPWRYTPDVYVEVDYFRDHAPDTVAIEQVKTAFANNGVTLHVQTDEEIPFHSMGIETEPITGGAGDTEFDAIKRDWFGEKLYREKPGSGDPHKYLTNKRQAFHYVLSVHSQEHDTGSSGTAEFAGNDMVISLGSFENQVGSTDQQAGTFMHELGHNLGLQHGGDDDTNCKPNYLSVMNYAYQFSVPVVRPLDYAPDPNIAGQEIDTLDENVDFMETKGIGAGGIGKHVTWSTGDTEVPDDGNEGIDWNNSGAMDDPLTAFDLNVNSALDCDGTGTTLTPHDDWGGLNFDLKENGNFLDGLGSVNVVDTEGTVLLDNHPLAPAEFSVKEITKEAVTKSLINRISSVYAELSPAIQGDYSQKTLEQKILNDDLSSALTELKALPSDEKIKSLIKSLESVTKMGMKEISKHDKYFNKKGILSGPLKQVSNGIGLTDEVCKPDYRLIRLDRDNNPKTQSTAVCIKESSVPRFLSKVLPQFIVADPGTCDLFAFPPLSEKYEENKNHLNSLVDSSSPTGGKLNCDAYFAGFDAEPDRMTMTADSFLLK